MACCHLPSASFLSRLFTRYLDWEVYSSSIAGRTLFGHGVVKSRLMMATIRNGSLWTCHAVGLSGTNGTYSGDASGTNVDRSAIQWLQLQISADDTTLTLQNHGRFFDSAATNAFWYYVPSLAVNCA